METKHSNSQVSLKLINFRNFKGEREFFFKKGVNLVEAPNSSGKTSLIEALRIFISDVDLDKNLINKEGEKSTLVLKSNDNYKLELLKDEETGENIRILNKSPVKNDFIEELSFITENHSIMQAALNKNFDIIKNWLIMLTDFPYYQKLYEITVKQIDKYKILKKSEQTDFFARKKQLLSLKSNLKSRRVLLRKIYEELINEQIEDEETKSILELETKLSGELNNKKERFNTLKTRIVTLEDEIQKAKSNLFSKESYLEEMEKKEISIPMIIEKQEGEIKGLEKEEEKLKQKCEEFSSKSKLIESQIIQLLNLIESKETECPTCFSKLTEKDLQNVITSKKREKQEIDKKILKIDKKLGKITLEIRKLDKEARKAKVSFPLEKAKIENEINQEKRKIRQINKKLLDSKNEYEVLEREVKNLEKKYGEVFSKAEKLKSKFSETNKKLKETENRLKEIDLQVEEINQEITGIEIKAKELNKYDSYISKLENVLNKISKKIKYIQEDIIDSLNDEITNLIEKFEFENIKEIFIDDNFKISITRTDNSRINYSDLSMFERKTIGVIIVYVLKKKLSNDFPFFVIDEYLNSLDEKKDKIALDYLKESNYIVILTKSSMEETNYGVLTQANISYI